jgi:hypothetical protein
MIAGLKFRTRDFLKDAGLAMRMLRKGKLKVIPSIKGARATRRIFHRVKKLEGKGS